MSRQPPPDPNANLPEVVDPRWILKALGISFAVALLLALITLSTYAWYRDHHPHPAPQQQHNP